MLHALSLIHAVSPHTREVLMPERQLRRDIAMARCFYSLCYIGSKQQLKRPQRTNTHIPTLLSAIY